MSTTPLSAGEAEFLRQAANYLEKPRLLMRLANMVGQPFEVLARKVMPDRVANVAEKALLKLMQTAATTVPTTGPREDVDFQRACLSSTRTGVMHQLATVGTGFAGGLFGLPGLALELPVSTGILFRSIATIADQFGEDLSDPAVRLDCLSVFSHGGPSPDDDALESTYFTVRLGLAELVRESAQFIALNSAKTVADALARGTAPQLIRLVGRVATQFNLAVSEKVLAQGLPVLGAAGGAAINAAFAEHFNTVARYHFGIRKLERLRGAEVVRAAYDQEVRALRSAP